MTRAEEGPRWHPALAGVALILLDFDGPLVRLLPDPEHLRLAERVARWRVDRTGKSPDAPAVDHVAVLRHLHRHDPGLAAEAEAMVTTVELAAAAYREAYPDAIGAMRLWLADGGRLAVVSNNAEQAVRRVLARSALADDSPTPGYTVHARRGNDLGRLKPGPDLLVEALRAHGVPPAAAVMVGDSVSDVGAGHAAGVRTIGVADSAERVDALHRAGAVAVVTRLADLHTRTPPGRTLLSPQ